MLKIALIIERILFGIWAIYFGVNFIPETYEHIFLSEANLYRLGGYADPYWWMYTKFGLAIIAYVGIVIFIQLAFEYKYKEKSQSSNV